MIRRPISLRRYGSRIVASGLLCLLHGCATLEVVDCENADWEQVGEEDGAAGAGPTTVDQHRATCARQGAEVDLVAYRAGMAAGRRRYCTPSNAYALGAQGEALPRVCPEDLRRAFERAHQAGHEAWQVHSAIEELRRAIRIKQQEIDAVEVDLEGAQAQVRADGLSLKQRAEWLSLANTLARQRQSLGVALQDLEEQLAATQSLLAQGDAAEDW